MTFTVSENIRLARERADAQAEHRRQSLLISQKQQLMEMLKLGIYTVEEVKQKIAELDAPPVRHAQPTPHTPRTPRTPLHRSSPRIRRFSPTVDGSPTPWEILNSQASLPDDTPES